MKFRKVLFILFTISIFSGCKQKTTQKTKNLNIVCTLFPQYDWTRCILGPQNEEVYITLIIKNGLDSHNFQPSEQDITDIKNADIVIYTGGKSEKWVEEILHNSEKEITSINLMECIGERQINDDEHLWLSLKNAKICCKSIEKTLSQVDAKNKSEYMTNLSKYLDELELLDKQFEYASKNAKQKTLIFADRFPFQYFTTDYNLEYYAAFDGCTTQTEAEPEAIDFLANKINELKTKYVYTIETSDDKLSNTIIKKAHNYDCEAIRIDSMQSTTLRSAIGGKTYLRTMQKNLEQLEKGLK